MGARPPTSLRRLALALLCVIALLSPVMAQLEYPPSIQYAPQYAPPVGLPTESSIEPLWPLPPEESPPPSDDYKPGFRKFNRYSVGSNRYLNEENFDSFSYQEDFTYFSASVSRQHLRNTIESASNAWLASIRTPVSTNHFGYQPYVSSADGFDAPSPWYDGPFKAQVYTAFGFGVTYAKSEFDASFDSSRIPDTNVDVSHWIAGAKLTFGRIANWGRWTIDWSVSALPGVQWTEFETEYRNTFRDERMKIDFGFATEGKIVSSYAIRSWTFDLGFQFVGIGPWYLAGDSAVSVDFPESSYAVVGNPFIGFTRYH